MHLPLRFAAALLALLVLDACTIRKVSVAHFADIQQLPPPQERAFSPNFDCGEAASAVQDMVCGSPTLSGLDRQLAAVFRQQLRQADLIGRDQLLATQRHWLLTRRGECRIPPARQQDLTPDPNFEACLARLYRERIAAVSAWSVALHADNAQAPISAYVAIKGADYRDTGLCTPLADVLQGAILRDGGLDPNHLPGVAELAGTHGAAELQLPYRLSVSSYEGGPDQGFQLRARALQAGAQPILGQDEFSKWVKAQPNSGGRFFLASSETKDFAAIDIIRYRDRLLVLAVEPWSYFSPAAIGESSYAGVYELTGPGQAEPRCLYKTYIRPPTRGTFDALPSYAALTRLLDQLKGEAPAEFDPNDRRDASLFDQQQRWMMLNLPLIGTAEVRQGGWAGWLHHRQDALLDALFQWSERDLPSKLLYRKLVALLRPAQDELVQAFQQEQGLTPSEAAQAAELVLLEQMAHSVGFYPGSAAIEAARPATLLAYRPRFNTAPLPGDLEARRPIRSLHSAVLNQLPADALADYVKYELLTPGHAHSLGAGGETSLMAAVERPSTIALLLQAGADPNEGNAWHKTALMLAAQLDQPDSVRALLDGGARPEAATIALTQDEGGIPMIQIHTGNRTALMYAAADAHPAVIKLLLGQGARPETRDTAGRNACDDLRDNALLSPAERADASAVLCRGPAS